MPDGKIFIDVHAASTKVALTEDGELVELAIERNSRVKCVGNMYKGTVQNVLPGMHAAFVNIGLERNGYLFVGGTLVDRTELVGEKPAQPDALSVEAGETVLVQVVKEPVGTKGARITQDVTVPGRFLVYMPHVDYIGISRKIEDEALRAKLYAAVDELREPGTGFIVRTAAATATPKELKQDAKFLTATFWEIQEAYETAVAPSCVYTDGDLVFRTLRDLYSAEVGTIVVNDADTAEYVKKALKKIAPKNKTAVKLYDEQADLFSAFQLDAQVEKLLQKKVWLKNGAYLVIDKTEALTVIDVNTGRYVGEDNLEETVFTANLLAAREIARQLRLRNVGGIIVVDFIDMAEEAHRERVVQELEECVRRDRIKTGVVGMTGLGLVELTRKKTRNDTASMLMQRCPVCGGDGVVESDEHMVMKIRAALLNAFRYGAENALITVGPELADALFRLRLLSKEIETVWSKKRIYVYADPKYKLREFKLEPASGAVMSLPEGAKLLY